MYNQHVTCHVLQPFLKFCFSEGVIHDLGTDSKGDICKAIGAGAHAHTIIFCRTVRPKKRVEWWLQQVDLELRETIRELVHQNISRYDHFSCAIQWPMQIGLSIRKILWTARVESILPVGEQLEDSIYTGRTDDMVDDAQRLQQQRMQEEQDSYLILQLQRQHRYQARAPRASPIKGKQSVKAELKIYYDDILAELQAMAGAIFGSNGGAAGTPSSPSSSGSSIARTYNTYKRMTTEQLTLEALMLQQLHMRDVMLLLVNDPPSNRTDFKWLRVRNNLVRAKTGIYVGEMIRWSGDTCAPHA